MVISQIPTRSRISLRAFLGDLNITQSTRTYRRDSDAWSMEVQVDKDQGSHKELADMHSHPGQISAREEK
jgi:hypothetical protein